MVRLLAVLVLAGASVNAQTITQTFGAGGNQFQIEFVTIGSPGNTPDSQIDTLWSRPSSPYEVGSVSYTYNIGKYEINRDMVLKANQLGGLGITLGDLTYKGGNGSNRPATSIDFLEAARFVNWLNTSTGSQAAYKFDTNGNLQLWASNDLGYNSNNLLRNSYATFWLPSSDEWYKAAFGSPSGIWFNYANGSDAAPEAVSSGNQGAIYQQMSPSDITSAGAPSAWQTVGQGGNALEWTETATDGVNDSSSEIRELRGGGWESGDISKAYRSGSSPSDAGYAVGFRVAMVPEPSSLSLLLAGGAVLMAGRRRKV